MLGLSRSLRSIASLVCMFALIVMVVGLLGQGNEIQACPPALVQQLNAGCVVPQAIVQQQVQYAAPIFQQQIVTQRYVQPQAIVLQQRVHAQAVRVQQIQQPRVQRQVTRSRIVVR